jgi:tripartite-type tricarboxylate transporter receptor subunit TctC
VPLRLTIVYVQADGEWLFEAWHSVRRPSSAPPVLYFGFSPDPCHFMPILRSRSIGGLLVLCLLAACGPSSGNEYPSRPLTYFVPWNPGGATDITSRVMASALQEVLGQPVNVVTRAGGAGVVGHLALAQARPDGYTIGATSPEITMMHWTGLTPLTYKDYTTLAVLVNNPAAVTVRADAPWNTLEELLESIRANPGTYRASGTSRGGIWDLARIGFLQAAGLEESALPWIPSQGAAPALQQLVAGGVHVVTAALVETSALRQAGQVKTLAVMADDRLEPFPEVPTLRELGLDWSVGAWISVAAPAGLPDDIRTRLVAAVEEATRSPLYTQSMAQIGFNVEHVPAEAVDEFLADHDRRNGELMRSAGMIQ